MLDAHCHIDHYRNPLNIAREAENLRIITIAVTNLPSHFEKAYLHLRSFKNIRPALGFHPQLAKQGKTERFIFERMLLKTSYIGEIGLDFSNEYRLSKDSQIDTLKFILNNITDRPRFISLHSRKAENVVLELLEEYNITNAVFHWYSGPMKVLEHAIDFGHYFSINHAMVRSNNGRKIIDTIPLDRMLTETDGPYIHVGNRESKPTDIENLLISLADIKKLSRTEIENQINSNFIKLISPIRINNSTLSKNI